MTELEFRRIVTESIQDHLYTADALESDDGSCWLVDRESIVTKDGVLIAEILHSPPRSVGIGCPVSSGLVFGDSAARIQHWRHA